MYKQFWWKLCILIWYSLIPSIDIKWGIVKCYHLIAHYLRPETLLFLWLWINQYMMLLLAWSSFLMDLKFVWATHNVMNHFNWLKRGFHKYTFLSIRNFLRFPVVKSFLIIFQIQYSRFLTSFLIFILTSRPIALTWWANKGNITLPKKGLSLFSHLKARVSRGLERKPPLVALDKWLFYETDN